MKISKLKKAVEAGEVEFFCDGGSIVARDKEGKTETVGRIPVGYVLQEMMELAPFLIAAQEGKNE